MILLKHFIILIFVFTLSSIQASTIKIADLTLAERGRLDQRCGESYRRASAQLNGLIANISVYNNRVLINQDYGGVKNQENAEKNFENYKIHSQRYLSCLNDFLNSLEYDPCLGEQTCPIEKTESEGGP